ncbi:hypothetical protein M231_04885 [Tremella mesenterica]|uniref:Uncharacterized protein n=2 Tax=Tremella mesenterica TaxID=5217 RepID=A0A4Q1BJQ2_TREME|nr:hypothetical protein M231_04885 [Tremella mesenterica]
MSTHDESPESQITRTVKEFQRVMVNEDETEADTAQWTVVKGSGAWVPVDLHSSTRELFDHAQEFIELSTLGDVMIYTQSLEWKEGIGGAPSDFRVSSDVTGNWSCTLAWFDDHPRRLVASKTKREPGRFEVAEDMPDQFRVSITWQTGTCVLTRDEQKRPGQESVYNYTQTMTCDGKEVVSKYDLGSKYFERKEKPERTILWSVLATIILSLAILS